MYHNFILYIFGTFNYLTTIAESWKRAPNFSKGHHANLGNRMSTRMECWIRVYVLAWLFVSIKYSHTYTRTHYTPVPLPVRSRLCQPGDQHPWSHCSLHLLARRPSCRDLLGCPDCQGEGCVLTLGPINQGIVDKRLQQGEEGLATSTQNTEDIFTWNSEQTLCKLVIFFSHQSI